MKTKITILSAVLLIAAMSVNAQITLKHLVLGETKQPKAKIGTLGGTEGMFMPVEINDGRAYQIAFIPSDRVYSDVFANIKDGIESKYGINFKQSSSSGRADYLYRANKDGVSYLLTYEHNRYMSPPIEFAFLITDEELAKVNKKEEKSKSNSDF